MIPIKYYIIGAIILVLMLLSGYSGYQLHKIPKPPEYRTEKSIIDSMLKVIPHDTLYIEGAGFLSWYAIHDTTIKNVYIKDSLLFANIFQEHKTVWDSIPIDETYKYILSKPFLSRLDTITKGDTISIVYDFPKNYFWLTNKPKPDSVYIYTITNTVVLQKHWYFGFGLHLGTGWCPRTSLISQFGLSFQLGYKIWEF